MYSAGQDGNVNSKCDICFVTVKEFLHESRRNFLPPVTSNIVQSNI